MPKKKNKVVFKTISIKYKEKQKKEGVNNGNNSEETKINGQSAQFSVTNKNDNKEEIEAKNKEQQKRVSTEDTHVSNTVEV